MSVDWYPCHLQNCTQDAPNKSSPGQRGIVWRQKVNQEPGGGEEGVCVWERIIMGISWRIDPNLTENWKKT